nr:leucine-rich repeat domain-containing protein [bacterium]
DLNASIRNCLNLYNIYIPENVINIGSNFISNCGVSNIKFNSNINSIGNNFIDSCENIQEIILPSSLKKIGNNAFVNCPNLYYIELPNGLQTVGSRLINNNITLTTLILPNSITSMELPVIGNNCNVNTIYTPFVGPNASTSRNYNDFNRSAVTTFALYVYGNLDVNQAFFNNLTNLNTFAVDGVVKGLGNKVFMYATNLQNIKFKGDFSCKFNELFNGITSLNDVVISGNFDLSDNFFNNMSINSLAVNSYNYIFNEAFTNSSINRAFLGKNGNLDAFSKRGFFDKALNYVTLMYLGIELTDIAREYSNVSSTTYTYFLQNYTIFD